MHQVRNVEPPFDSESFWTHYGGRGTTVCLFGKITAPSYWGGESIGFTSGTRNVYLAAHDLTFYASPGINPTVVEMVAGTESASVESILQFSSNAITEEDLEAGKWNYAKLELWLMNYEAFGMGEFVVYSGYLGDVTNAQTYFKAEAVGGHSLLKKKYGNVTARICRLKTGVGQCQLDLNGITSDGFLITNTLNTASVTDKYNLVLDRDEDVPDDFYNHGLITALSGANAGLSREVKQGTGFGTPSVNVTLRRTFPFPITPGQDFAMRIGDDKTLQRCIYLEQVINRSAEDYVPTIEDANRFPSAA